MPRGESRKQHYLEIQLHPHDIRRAVRYFFLTRRQLAITAGGLTLWLALVVGALAATPSVVRNLWSRYDYETQLSQRVQQGQRLESLVRRLEGLSAQAEDLRLRMHKIYLAYGLSSEESIGQGGFPFAPGPVPESIYADRVRHGKQLSSEVEEDLHVVGAFVEEVQAFEDAHRAQISLTPSICPLDRQSFVLTSPFGTRRNPFTKGVDFHAGIDLAAPTGTEIHAPADGVVVFAGRYPLKQSVAWWRYGNLVALRHGDRFITLFGHCDQVRVRRGQQVEQGTVLATVGSTGWSTNPHLHYEVRRKMADGEYRPIDPRIYMLNQRWRDEERVLVAARRAPQADEYEPLPSRIAR